MQKIIQQFILQDWADNSTSPPSESEHNLQSQCVSEEVHLTSIEPTFTEECVLPIDNVTIQYSLEELESAKLAAYTEGYNQAMQEHTSKQENDVNNILNKISEQIDSLIINQSEYSQTQFNLINKTALQIAKKVIGDIPNKKSIERIAKFVEEAVQIISSHPNLVLCINPAAEEFVNEKLAHLIVKDGNQSIEIELDENISEGNCIVKWPQGYMEYNQDKIFQKIESILLKPNKI